MRTIKREHWEDHANYPNHVLLLGSHENFRRISSLLLDRVRLSGYEAGIESLYRRWKSAMRGHEHDEENKLYPYLNRRWGIVPNGVSAGRRNEGAESSEEGVRGHLSIGGPEAGGLLEEDADLTVRCALDGVLSERRPQEIATQPLEATAVATVDGDGGMQLHAEGGDEQG